MNLRELKEEIKRDEGVVYEIYRDHLGYKTFGVGHLIKRHDPEYFQVVGAPVSKERVDEAFEIDLQNAIKDTESLYKNFDSLPVDVQHILVNMMFNLGYYRLSGFRKMKAAIDKGDWQQAAREMEDSRWYEQVGNRSKRLVKRMENVSNDNI